MAIYKQDNYGVEPMGEDLVEIEKYAESAMNVRFGANMALLTVSNALQFGNIMKSFTDLTGKRVTGSLITELQGKGKVGLVEGSLDQFEKKAAKTFAGKAWDVSKPLLANMFTEGVYEEGGQFASGEGVHDYYTRKYKNLSNPDNLENWNTLNEVVDSTLKGLAEQFGSTEGRMNMIMGAITAMLTGSAQMKIDQVRGMGKDKRLAASVNTLNRYGMTGILEKTYSDTLDSMGIAKEMEKAVESGDIFKYKNLKNEMFFKFVMSRIPGDMHDVTIEQLNMLKDLSKEQFESTFGLDFNATNKSTVNEYVDSLIDSANKINDTYKAVSKSFVNPFNTYTNPKTDEQIQENVNHSLYEDWKEEITYHSTVGNDFNSRLDSIQQDVLKINPLLNIDLLSKLTDATFKQSLKELSKDYIIEADRLMSTITEYTPAADRTNIRNRAKALRSNAERIDLAYRNREPLDLKTFTKLLNFELNEREIGRDDIIGPEKAAELYNYGHDINRIKFNKVRVSERLDALTSKEGFEKYFEDSYEAQQQKYEATEEEGQVTPEAKFKNKDGKDQKVDIGRQYKTDKTLTGKINPVADSWQVLSPTGTVISTHTNEEAAKKALADYNEDLSYLKSVKVIGINSNGTLKVEDSSGNIQDIEVSLINGYSSLKTLDEELAEERERIKKILDDIESRSGSSTGPPTDDDMKPHIMEPSLKDAPILFSSTISESEGSDDVDWKDIDTALSKPHVKRSRVFLNNARKFKNRNNLRAIVFTAKQAKSLGLDGLVQMSYNLPPTVSLDDIKGVDDINNGFIASVFVEQVGDKFYFVDEEGKRINRTGYQLGKEWKPVDINRVVFQTMPTTKLTNSKGFPRYRKDQEDDAKAYQQGWFETRKGLFEKKEGDVKVYEFRVSRGIPMKSDTPNSVSDTLVTEDLIENQRDLLKVSVTGTVFHDSSGRNVSFRPGIVVLQHDDLLQILNNNKFGEKRAKGIYNVIKALAQQLKDKKTINPEYAKFLQNVLYWKKTDKTEKNQIYVDIEKNIIAIGGNKYSIDDVLTKGDEIVNILKDVNHNINKNTLEKDFDATFRDYGESLDNPPVWTNYQTYLLSSKNPDGSSRDVGATPLITSLVKPTESVPYNYKQKYAILQEFEIPYTASSKKGTEDVKVGEYILDGETPNTFTSPSGPIIFKATLKNGDIEVLPIEANQTIKNVATTPASLDSVVRLLKTQGLEKKISTDNPVVTVSNYYNVIILAKLNDLYNKQKEGVKPPPPAPPTPPAPEYDPGNVGTPDDAPPFAVSGNNTDPDIRKKYFGETGVTTDKKLLDDIGRSNHPLAPLARKLSKYARGVQIHLIESDNVGTTPTGGLAAGVSYGHVIDIAEFARFKGKSSEPTLIHEILHSFTTEYINSLGADSKELAEFNRLYNEAKSKLTGDYYGLLNLDEFFVALFTDAELISQLQRIESTKPTTFKNLLQEILDYILSLFGITSGTTLYEDAFAVATNILERSSETTTGIKEGVAELFESNPELADIGTPEQYSQYLDTIFPDSKVKDIVYHRSNAIFDKFDKSKIKEQTKRFYFSPIANSPRYGKNRIAAILNVKNLAIPNNNTFIEQLNKEHPEYTKDKSKWFHLPSHIYQDADKYGFDGVKEFENNPDEEYSVYEPEQIHILGSKQDIEGFKGFVATQKEWSIPYKNILYAPVEGINEKTAAEYVDDMTIRAAMIIFGEDKMSLFEIEKMTSEDVFGRIKDMYSSERERKYQSLGDTAWRQLVKRTKEKLRTIGINFNEEDKVDINSNEASNREYAPEPFTVDWKKTSPYAVKIVLATLPKTKRMRQEKEGAMELPKVEFSKNAKGYISVNFSKMFSTLMNLLSNTTKHSEFEQKLAELARKDSDFVRLFARLGGDLSTGRINFSKFGKDEWRLFINFFQTFTKQRPDAEIQYISAEGSFTGQSGTQREIDQIKKSWVENLKDLSNKPTSPISWDRKNKTYKFKKTKEFPAVVPKTAKDAIPFLNSLGIVFTSEMFTRLNVNKDKKERRSEQEKFFTAVSSLYNYLQKAEDLVSLTDKSLGVSGQFTALAELSIKSTNPNLENTRFNVEGNKRQNFESNNYVSVFENEFNSVSTLDQLFEERPELRDPFTRNALILKKGGRFFNKNGERIRSIKIGFIEGTDDIVKNKGVPVSKLELGDRLVTGINQNMNGNYYILIPADASTEWMLNLGNHIDFGLFFTNAGRKELVNVFMNYLEDDINLAKDSDVRSKLKAVGNKGSELRVFKDILSDVENGRLVSSQFLMKIDSLIEKGSSTEEIMKFVRDNQPLFEKYIDEYFNEDIQRIEKMLIDTNKVAKKFNKEGDLVYEFSDLDDTFALNNNIRKDNITEDQFSALMMFLATNFSINNIEMHKLIFGDPYQFEIKNGKLDETKRLKSFLSPRRLSYTHPAFESWANSSYNEYKGIAIDKKELGYTNFRPYVKTVTIQDVTTSTNRYEGINEANGMSYLSDSAYKQMKIRNGQWTNAAEEWHQWQMAYTRMNLPGYKYVSEELKEQDRITLSKPEPVHTIEVLKPIATGTKAKSNHIDLVLDKYSQMPLYYKAVKGTALAQLYEKMWREDVDYVVMESGRKVGSTEMHPLYKGREFNTDPFNNTIEISWKNYGIQVETAYEKAKQQPRGSQLTKLSSLDLFENGQPIGDETRREIIRRAYNRNKEALRRYHKFAYESLLEKLGIEDLGNSFRFNDPAKVQQFLYEEMIRRDLPENVKDNIELDENGQFPIAFEATSSYIQIRNIIFSLVDKALTSPKMNGSAKVQVPVTLWENSKEGRGLLRKVNDVYQKITAEEYDNLSDEEKKDVVLTDNTLKFYTKEDPYCEVMLPNWLRGHFDKRRFPTDESILNYLNSTDEDKKILQGIGFRIPTQAMASIETFRVKGFLEPFMGDTVVVPSELEAKTGGDFDIDKLNTYLKSVYVDENGDVRLVKFIENEETTREFFNKLYDKTVIANIGDKIERINKYNEFREKLIDTFKIIENLPEITAETISERFADDDFYHNHVALLQNIINEAGAENINPSVYIANQIERLSKSSQKLMEDILDKEMRDKFVNRMYKSALENEYYESLEELLTLEENFERMLSPIGNAGLKDLSVKLDKLRGYDETGIRNRMLSRSYITELRHSFITAKRWVGIAAVNITGHSLAQKTALYFDRGRLYLIRDFDRRMLGDMSINIPHNKVTINNEVYPSLSGTKTADGEEYISDRLSGYITSFVDVAKDPYIMKIISSNSVIGTFMLLERLGTGKTGIMFMNQPIIREYINYLAGIGVKGIYSKKHIAAIKDRFGGDTVEPKGFDYTTFEENIRDYHSKGLSDSQNAEQQAILDEFLKYSKMAEYSLRFSMAINYDTTKFDSSEAINKKRTREGIARESNIISSVDGILEETFIGEMSDKLSGAFTAVGEILKLEKDEFAEITNDILDPYYRIEFMSPDTFSKIGKKLKTSFIDYIVQVQSGLNDLIKPFFIDEETSVAKRFMKAKEAHPELEIFEHLTIDSTNRGGNDNNVKIIKLIFPHTDAYNINLYAGMMRELKEAEPQLYEDIIKMVILQGTYQNPLSIQHIIPAEDYSRIVGPIINRVRAASVKNFKEGWFQRNNWRDEDIVPTFYPKYFTRKDEFGMDIEPMFDEYGNEYNDYIIPAFESNKKLSEIFRLPKNQRTLLFVNEDYNANEVQYDVIKVPRLLVNKDTGEKVDIVTGQTVTGSMIRAKLLKGDFSYYTYYGYQKVKYTNNEPVVTLKGEHIYKMVNLYGYSGYVSEYYDTFRESVVNNGTVRVKQEMEDTAILRYFEGKTDDTLYKGTLEMLSSNIKKIKEGTKTITNRTYRLDDGQYTLPDGSVVNVSYMGTFKVIDGNKMINLDDKKVSSLDKFAEAEGFLNWEDFVKNNEFSKQFIQGKESRYVYEVSPVSADEIDGDTDSSTDMDKLKSFISQFGKKNFELVLDRLKEENLSLQIEYEDKDGENSGEIDNSDDIDSISELSSDSEVIFTMFNPNTFDTVDILIGTDEFIKYIQPYVARIRPTFFDKSQLEIPFPAVKKHVDKTEEKTFTQNGTSYRFVLKNGIPVEGYYKQHNKEEKPLSDKKIVSKYNELSSYKPVPGAVKKSILNMRSNILNYTEGQRGALLDIENMIDSNKQGYYLLAGYAGTGKTTVAENIARYGQSLGKSILIMAPTNKAARVLNDKIKNTGVDSNPTTIHKAIYGEPDPVTGEWIPKKKITNSVIIIDESSMIPKELMKDLLYNTMGNNSLIFMGDSFQLEQIGEDSGLFKLLTDKKVMDNLYGISFNQGSQLTEVKRQNLDSNVLKVATITRTDNKPYVPSRSVTDFDVVDSRRIFIDKYKEAIRNNEDAVMIVATNKERMLMNSVAREEKFGKERKILHEGDVLISVANSNSHSNSETFKVTQIRGELSKHEIEFVYDNKTSVYNLYIAYAVDEQGLERKVFLFPGLDKSSLYHPQVLNAIRSSNIDLYNELDNDYDIVVKRGVAKLNPNIIIATYGYAVTGHKSQGSQWQKVFVNQDYVAPTWNAARWYYTAITRSSQEVIVLPTGNNVKIDPTEIENKINQLVEPDVVEAEESVEDNDYVELSEFYNSLTEEQKMSAGTLEDLIDEFNSVPFTFTEQDFIQELKCRI